MTLKNIVLPLLAVAAVTLSCGGCQWRERTTNLENSRNLRVGMSKEQVISVMGQPLADEAYSSPNLWFYYIDTKWYDGLATEDECMPLVFKNGKLVGWGNDFYNQIRLAGEYIE